MGLRAIALAPLPPMPGGGSVSRAEILSGIARAGGSICILTPISKETRMEGVKIVARHPELSILHYLVPALVSDIGQGLPTEFTETEREQVHRLVDELVLTFRPNLLIAGRESQGALTRELALIHNLPWCLWLRGVPTGDIVAGLANPDVTQQFLDVVRSADLVISVAEHFSSILERDFGIKGIKTIPNAIDCNVFRPWVPTDTTRKTFGIPLNSNVVLMAGTLIPRKRPMDLMEAAHRVLEKNPRTVFVFAGDGPLRPALFSYSHSRGFDDRVRFLGTISHDEMPVLYNVADVVAMTSETEGLSRVYLEAMACGRPLLASDIASARELIEDGRNGFLFPLSDCHALAEKINMLLGDGPLRCRVGPRARASVRARMPERAVTMYLKEFDELLSRT